MEGEFNGDEREGRYEGYRCKDFLVQDYLISKHKLERDI